MKANNLTRASRPVCGVFLAGILSACGGGGGGSASTGSLTLSLTDAPVDGAQQVVVTFTAVTLKPASGDAVTYTLGSPQSINLLALSNGTKTDLLDGQTVTAGQYNWVRLTIDEANTYLIDSIGGQHSLNIPSGAETGLKLNRNFTVAENGSAAFTIDFDLRQSVHKTGAGIYQLRPTLRIVEDSGAGTLSGSVSAGLITAGCKPAVYVFDASNGVDDMDGDSGDPELTVKLPDNGPYTFNITTLDAGSYRIAFTCNADQDNPGEDNSGSMTFTGETTVTVTAGQTTTHTF